MGNVLYDPDCYLPGHTDNNDPTAQLYFVHKKCGWAFEDRPNKGPHFWWEQLDWFLVFLGQNTSLDIEKTVKRIAVFEGGTSFFRPQLPDWLEIRKEVFTRDNHTCRYCGRRGKGVKLECDHIIPVSKGGPNNLDNLVTACFECNRSKGDKTVDEWLSRELSETIDITTELDKP